jgi:hypothetical protein
MLEKYKLEYTLLTYPFRTRAIGASSSFFVLILTRIVTPSTELKSSAQGIRSPVAPRSVMSYMGAGVAQRESHLMIRSSEVLVGSVMVS